VENRKRWTSSIILAVAKNLGVDKIQHSAWYLRIFGFHERALDRSDEGKISIRVKKMLFFI